MALFLNNSRYTPIPKYIFALLTCYIQPNYGTNYHHVPLQFQQARKTSSFRRLHSFHCVFKAIDSMTANGLGSHLGSHYLPAILEIPIPSYLCSG